MDTGDIKLQPTTAEQPVQSAPYKEPNEEMSTSRLEAFSDGVFAIAITLLVLEVHAPDFKLFGTPNYPASLWDFIKEQWPVYMAYLSSFLLIGIIWINHHIIYRYIARTDRWLLNLNLLLLLAVSFIPYPTDVLGEAIKAQLDRSELVMHPASAIAADTTTAALLYIGTLLVMGLAFVLLWGYAIKDFRLVDKQADPKKLRGRQRANYIGLAIFAAAFIAAIFNAAIGIAITFVVSVIFFVPRGDDRFLANAFVNGWASLAIYYIISVFYVLPDYTDRPKPYADTHHSRPDCAAGRIATADTELLRPRAVVGGDWLCSVCVATVGLRLCRRPPCR